MSPVAVVQVGVILALAASLAVKVAAQRRQGIRSVVIGRAGDGVVARVEPLSLLLLFTWFGLIAVHGIGWLPGLFGPRLFRSPTVEALGALLALAALALQLTSLWQMGRSWRIGIDPGSEQTLVTSGVFAISRNPIYVALDGIAVAAFLMTGSLFFLVTGLVVVAGIHVQILREEAYLATAFGEPYARYRARVPRYLGRVAPAGPEAQDLEDA